jgi:phosphatidylglycerophosphate synthase
VNAHAPDPGPSPAAVDAATPPEKRDDIRRNQPLVYYLYRPIGLRLCVAAARRGISPDRVTCGGLVLSLLTPLLVGGAAAAAGERASLVGGVVLALVMAALEVLDCVDGDLARFAGKESAFGAWLDGFADQVKKLAVFICLGGLTQWGGEAVLPGVARHGLALGLAAALAMLLARFVRDSAAAAMPEPVYPFRHAGPSSPRQRLFHRLAGLESFASLILPVAAVAGGVDLFLLAWAVYALGDLLLSATIVAGRR